MRAAEQDVAAHLVRARRSARALGGFPGDLPATLGDAYRVQDAAIAGWGEPVVGWKVGGIPPDWRERLGAERLVGPVFAGNLWPATAGARLALPAIPGGTACIEAEVAVVVARDVPARPGPWTLEQAHDEVGGLRLAVELAGSGVPDINVLGPLAVAADLGNNAGLVAGPEVPHWRDGAWLALDCRTEVDGVTVGRGTPGGVEGGPLEAFRFALQVLGSRGRDLRAGDLVATGAVTGIHDVVPGRCARVVFGDLALDIDLVPATPAGATRSPHG